MLPTLLRRRCFSSPQWTAAPAGPSPLTCFTGSSYHLGSASFVFLISTEAAADGKLNTTMNKDGKSSVYYEEDSSSKFGLIERKGVHLCLRAGRGFGLQRVPILFLLPGSIFLSRSPLCKTRNLIPAPDFLAQPSPEFLKSNLESSPPVPCAIVSTIADITLLRTLNRRRLLLAQRLPTPVPSPCSAPADAASTSPAPVNCRRRLHLSSIRAPISQLNKQIDKSMIWEGGDNRVLKFPKSGSFEMICHWNMTTMVQLQQTGPFVERWKGNQILLYFATFSRNLEGGISKELGASIDKEPDVTIIYPLKGSVLGISKEIVNYGPYAITSTSYISDLDFTTLRFDPLARTHRTKFGILQEIEKRSCLKCEHESCPGKQREGAKEGGLAGPWKCDVKEDMSNGHMEPLWGRFA
ncbi:hypothetical protein LXL04_030093 [Taraxacum kok-saghyz]